MAAAGLILGVFAFACSTYVVFTWWRELRRIKRLLGALHTIALIGCKASRDGIAGEMREVARSAIKEYEG